MRFKKAQSTTEQLITYGWALMIITIIVGVLVHFGAISLSSATPDMCIFQNGFACTSHRIYAGAGGELYVDIAFANKLTKKVSITAMLCSAEPPNPSTGYPASAFTLVPPATPIIVNPEMQTKLTLPCINKDSSTNANPGESYTGLVYIKYRELEYVHGLYEETDLSRYAGDRMKIANIGGKIN
jgi:hypothetical protein